jgi:hypothetical protein
MPSKNTVKKKNVKWDKPLIEKAASFFTSRSEFAENNKPAYEAARLMNMLDDLFDLKLNQWTEDAVKKEALKFSSRTEFARHSGAAYNAARRLKIISQLYPSKLKSWGIDEIEEIAKTCANKKELKRKCATAYNAALRLGVIDLLFANQLKINTRDCVYLWAVAGETDLYKVGITSEAMGHHRIHQVAKEANVQPELIFLKKVGYENAKVIERNMKRLGVPYKFSKKFYGHSEFRYLSPQQVQECINMVLTVTKGV